MKVRQFTPEHPKGREVELSSDELAARADEGDPNAQKSLAKKEKPLTIEDRLQRLERALGMRPRTI